MLQDFQIKAFTVILSEVTVIFYHILDKKRTRRWDLSCGDTEIAPLYFGL